MAQLIFASLNFKKRAHLSIMRILFSGTPGYGHLLPLLPLARAFRQQGDDVAFTTAQSVAPLFASEDVELLPAGPPLEVMLGELVRRTGTDPAAAVTAEVQAEFFGGIRIDATFDDALSAARSWRPDLILGEHYDFVGPLLGAALDVPAGVVAISPPLGAEFDTAAAKVFNGRAADRDITVTPLRWYFDTIPSALHLNGSGERADRLTLRPEAHHGAAWRPTAAPAAMKSRPMVLVSFGTIHTAPAVIGPILRQLAEQDIDVTATLGPANSAESYGIDADNVTFVEFTPLAEVFQGVDLLVGNAGAGTTLGALAEGIPLVAVPLAADQFLVADRVQEAGAGLALPEGGGDAGAVANAVGDVLADASFRAAAQKVAAQIAELTSPADTAAMLRGAV